MTKKIEIYVDIDPPSKGLSGGRSTTEGVSIMFMQECYDRPEYVKVELDGIPAEIFYARDTPTWKAREKNLRDPKKKELALSMVRADFMHQLGIRQKELEEVFKRVAEQARKEGVREGRYNLQCDLNNLLGRY